MANDNQLRGKKSKNGLTRNSRIRFLELDGLVRDLEKRVQFLELMAGVPQVIEEDPVKSGPAPRVTDEDLFDNRERLIEWLEAFWRYLGPRLNRAKNAADLQYPLEVCAGPAKSRSYYQSFLIDNRTVLWEFLQSSHYHQKPSTRAVTDALTRPFGDVRRVKGAAKLPPRQIADAMAGVSKIGWRTSLDRCSKNPSRQVVGIRTAQHYAQMYKIPLPKA